ncbi:uncharacterized protein B0I36DRAFT_39109 [Microdochium trichocladiopsis]|uniref:Uncharacterized protein n=1 Tax=Microdochium trichocladiopsis TaxID=1682393 RepID=A0A9P8XXQ5_9PEZI|nr:uncharacterized protein B0I36DRAFT_39109 [Microdochium trichocladiopsis]KAH7018417.1 hypothetical protein B0I36DRAFT_39109 [Microdochium trichocladiopsis]
MLTRGCRKALNPRLHARQMRRQVHMQSYMEPSRMQKKELCGNKAGCAPLEQRGRQSPQKKQEKEKADYVLTVLYPYPREPTRIAAGSPTHHCCPKLSCTIGWGRLVALCRHLLSWLALNAELPRLVAADCGSFLDIEWTIRSCRLGQRTPSTRTGRLVCRNQSSSQLSQHVGWCCHAHSTITCVKAQLGTLMFPASRMHACTACPALSCPLAENDSLTDLCSLMLPQNLVWLDVGLCLLINPWSPWGERIK